ncbi:MAG: M6 family metalloprotease domain-containing protein [Prevotella sp.]|nr:M6 family metalloprotease domain-containing protein [Prevotella sp.]
MKKILLMAVAAMMATVNVGAQRMGCFRGGAQTRADYSHYLPAPYDFDPQKTYRQPVVLISFDEADFSMENPAAYYDRLFNEPGFNNGAGPGCVADYFREQSAGRLNLQFDIYGPVKVDEPLHSSLGINYGDNAMHKAINKLCETETTDFSIYDWDGDGMVNQVLFVAASFTGNQKPGYIWPNTGFLHTRLPGGMMLFNSSISCELWSDGSQCGMGTIIHEYCHCLGLPDFYPMQAATAFSAVDEWDLMDGGNYTNKGWCPPNLTAMERMYLGWATPVELTEATTIEDMKPLSDGGTTYIVRSDTNSNEYYLLENRRQEGWDYGCPGNGLLIYHVDFDEEKWLNNEVNISDTHYRYSLFHADGKNYMDWDPTNDGKDKSKWTMEGDLRNSYLSTSPYPYTNPLTLEVNASLTDESSPAATLFTPNADGRNYMGKAITNIKMAADGSISFNFMKDDSSGITTTASNDAAAPWFSIDGRRMDEKPMEKGVYIHNGKKVVIL